jgi:hypothetical protein
MNQDLAKQIRVTYEARLGCDESWHPLPAPAERDEIAKAFPDTRSQMPRSTRSILPARRTRVVKPGK